MDTGKLSLARLADDKLRLQAELGGEFPAVRSYSAKAHGYGLATNLPVLLVKLQHRGNAYRYAQLQDLVLKQIDLTVTVSGLRTLAVSNDFGPVDSSKPFQPFGASPVAGNALIVGSREAFQKTLNAASLELNWLATPLLYPSGDPLPSVSLRISPPTSSTAPPRGMASPNSSCRAISARTPTRLRCCATCARIVVRRTPASSRSGRP